jgi:hypothetical protein
VGILHVRSAHLRPDRRRDLHSDRETGDRLPNPDLGRRHRRVDTGPGQRRRGCLDVAGIVAADPDLQHCPLRPLNQDELLAAEPRREVARFGLGKAEVLVELPAGIQIRHAYRDRS